MARRHLRAAAWIGTLVGAAVLLRLAATDGLATPPVGSLDDLGTWADDRGPVASAFGLVRFAAELAVWYLLALTALAGAGRARTWVDHLAPAAIGRVVRAGLGVGVVASSAVPTGGPALAEGQPGTAVMQPAVEPPVGTARMEPVPAPVPSPVPTQHRVEPGESFWTIASDVLEQRWGREPTDAEIDPYWRALVEANRHRLVSDDPDLVVPGQVFELPPPPP